MSQTSSSWCGSVNIILSHHCSAKTMRYIHTYTYINKMVFIWFQLILIYFYTPLYINFIHRYLSQTYNKQLYIFPKTLIPLHPPPFHRSIFTGIMMPMEDIIKEDVIQSDVKMWTPSSIIFHRVWFIFIASSDWNTDWIIEQEYEICVCFKYHHYQIIWF